MFLTEAVCKSEFVHCLLQSESQVWNEAVKKRCIRSEIEGSRYLRMAFFRARVVVSS